MAFWNAQWFRIVFNKIMIIYIGGIWAHEPYDDSDSDK